MNKAKDMENENQIETTKEETYEDISIVFEIDDDENDDEMIMNAMLDGVRI